MKEKIYWAIEDKKGNLATSHSGRNLFVATSKKEAQSECFEGERPVKVKIVRVE